jgi:hypothetical protein
MNHKFYVVVFKQAGIGTPYRLQSERGLQSLIKKCIENGHPFKVGHEHRMTLNDGVKEN